MKMIEGKPQETGVYFTRCVNNGDVYYKVQCFISEDHLDNSSWTEYKYKYVTHYISLDDIEKEL